MIGFIGGTGPEGRGLALRFALAGEDILIGSRDAARAWAAADSVREIAPSLSIGGGMNADVAAQSDTVVVAVPYAAQRPTLESLTAELRGKLIINVVAPPHPRSALLQSIWKGQSRAHYQQPPAPAPHRATR